MRKWQSQDTIKNKAKTFTSFIYDDTTRGDDWKALLPDGIREHLLELLGREDLSGCEKILKDSYIRYLYMIRDTKLNMREAKSYRVFQSYISKGYFNHLVANEQELNRLRSNLDVLESQFNQIINTIENILNNRINKMSIYNKKFIATANVTFNHEGSFAAMQSKSEKQSRRGLRFVHKQNTATSEYIFEYPVNIDHKIINPFLFIWLDGDVTKFEALHKYTNFQDTGSYTEAGGTSNMFMSVLAHELTHISNLHVYSPTYVEKILTDQSYIPEEVKENSESERNDKSKLNIRLEDKINANEFLKLRTKKTSIFKRYSMPDDYVRSIAEIEAGLSMLWFGLFYGIIQIWSYLNLQSFILKNSYQYITNSIEEYIKSKSFDANKFVQKFMIHNYLKIQSYVYQNNLLSLVGNSDVGAQSAEDNLRNIQEIMNTASNRYGLDFGWYSMINSLLDRMNDFIFLTITEYLAYVGQNIAKKIAQAINNENAQNQLKQLTNCLDLEENSEAENSTKINNIESETNQYNNTELVNEIANTAILKSLDELLYRVNKDVSSYVSYVQHYFGTLIFNTSTMLITLLAIAKIVNAAFVLSKYKVELKKQNINQVDKGIPKSDLFLKFIKEIADVSRYAQLYYNGAHVRAKIPLSGKEKEYRILSKENFIVDVADYLIKVVEYLKTGKFNTDDIDNILTNLKACISRGLNFSNVKTIGGQLDKAFIHGHEIINSYINDPNTQEGEHSVQSNVSTKTKLRWGIYPSVSLVTSSTSFNELQDLLLKFEVRNDAESKIIEITDNGSNKNINIFLAPNITINTFDEFSEYINRNSREGDNYLIKWLGIRTATMAAMQSTAVKAVLELFLTFQDKVNNFRDVIQSNINHKSLVLSNFTETLKSELINFVKDTWRPMIASLNDSDNDNAISVPENIHFRKKIHGLLGYSKDREKHPRVTLLYESLLGPCSVSDFGVLTSELHYDYVICYGIHGKLMYLAPETYEALTGK